ncbi:GlsB/YeaQ/YmgE family stress response membrane protein [Crossiella cryophila]|uniref:Putative membrane protein YeaQ/YmgE (Transglycosylase-associated protein family) n=1 Tax=Crossiella cryophila TaxID=43355 RepID=A0A7W7CIX4_9PSEU|nr:GlsB/YeaQ/YmgE family stress response membrane protein [Crossiella cryophila]MBB4681990.1 putative membrane protein YeaQ/YmgE (transglycosylase-associated protein family) [Crossiella cryophila]
MGILGWIVVGLIAGALAKAIMPGNDPGGILVTMLIGIVGGVIGGFVGRLIFNTDTGSFFNLRTWLLSILGAVIVLAIYRVVVGKKTAA